TLYASGAVQCGAVVAAATWLALAIGESAYPWLVLLAAAVALALPSVFLAGWALRLLRAGGRAALLPVACLLSGLAVAVVLYEHVVWAFTAWAAGLALAVPFVQSRDEPSSIWGV